jgi:hypothetical protein
MCYLVPGCTHYTWFFRDNQQNCCLKNGPRSYSSLVDRPDLAPIVSEILVSLYKNFAYFLTYLELKIIFFFIFNSQ